MNEEDELEAWNTWKGRYQDPDLTSMLKSNPCNECRSFIGENGEYTIPDQGAIYKSTEMYFDGTFGIPWPFLPIKFKEYARNNITTESNEIIAGYRARWCALFSDISDYREKIIKILKKNDHENIYLNSKLKAWNNELGKRGFPIFNDNDLRGINLCALDLAGDDFNGINLRKIDFSYSDLNFAQLKGANLYKSKFNFCDAYGVNLSFSICSSITISHSMFSNSKIVNSDLTQSMIGDGTFYNSILDGSNLSKSELKRVNFTECSFSEHVNSLQMKNTPTNLSGAVVENCKFENLLVRNNLIIIDDNLKKIIQDQNQDNKKLQELWKSVELKPGIFGISIDIKHIFKQLFNKGAI